MRLFPKVSPRIAHYPKAIQDQLEKPEPPLRSLSEQEEYEDNCKAIERIALFARRDPVYRILLLVLVENVRKDFQIMYLREQIAAIRGEIRCLKAGPTHAEKS